MPVVPMRQDGGVQNQLVQTPNVQSVPVDTSPIVNGVAKVAEVWQKARDDADRMRVLSARTDLQRQINDLTYGENGYARAQGINAMYAGEMARKGYEQAVAGMKKNLNARQLELLQPQLDSMTNSFDASLQNHVFQENRKAQVATVNDDIQVNKDTIAKNYANPLGIENALIGLDEGITNLEAITGIVSPVFRKQQRSDAIKNAISGAMDAYDLPTAQGLVKNYEKDLTEDDRLFIDRALRPMVADAESTQMVQDFVSKHGLRNSTAMANYLLTIDDKQKRQDVQAKYKMLQQADDDRQEDLYSQAAVMLTLGQTVPPSMIMGMEPKNQARFVALQRSLEYQNDVRQEATQRSAAKKQVTDFMSIYYDHPEQLKDVSLKRAAGIFVDAGMTSTYEQLLKAQGAQRGDLAAGKDRQYMSQQVNARLKALGKKPSDNLSMEAYQWMQNTLDELNAQNGDKPITRQQIDDAVSAGFTKGELVNSWYWPNNSGYSFQSEGRGKPFRPGQAESINDVPSAFKQAFIHVAKSKGRAYTNSDIVNYYNSQVGN